MEPTWPAGSRCQGPLIDSGLPAGVSYRVTRSCKLPGLPALVSYAQAALPAPAGRLISRPLGRLLGLDRPSAAPPIAWARYPFVT
jgi:hypothetical protein